MSRDKDDDEPEGHEPSNKRRAFMRTAAAVAVGAGVFAVTGDAGAAPKSTKKNRFQFSTNIAPAALTTANIAKITDAIAASMASEAQSGMEQAAIGFHIRIGGEHSRTFSRTSEHKNVIHSNVIIDGSGDGPF